MYLEVSNLTREKGYILSMAPETGGTLQAGSRHNYVPKSVIVDEKRGVLLVVVDRGVLCVSDLDVRAEAEGFSKKKEYHIMVIGLAAAKTISQTPLPDVRQTVRDIAAQFAFSFAVTSERFHIAREYPGPPQEKRDSYIQMVDMPDVQMFYSVLNERLGIALEVPPLHITTHAKSTNQKNNEMGIGVNSYEELSKLIVVKI